MKTKCKAEFVDWSTAHKQLQEYKADGVASVSTFQGRIFKNNCWQDVLWVDQNTAVEYEGKLVSAGFAAANELRKIGCKRIPANNTNREYANPPKFVVPGAHRNAVYIDLKAAYAQIYRRLAWDIDCLPSKFIFRVGEKSLAGVAENLMTIKLARNAVVGIALSRTKTLWTQGQFHTIKRPGGLFNPQLGWACWAVLTGAAYLAKSCGAIYWNSDGGIFPENCVDNALRMFANNDLIVSIKDEGHCVVWGNGRYNFLGQSEYNHNCKFGVAREYLLPAPFALFALKKWQSLTPHTTS